jgi:HD-like signal output (HDOD) protein
VVVLANAIPAYKEALGHECTWTQLAEHDRQFGVDHVLIGYLVSRYWRLPVQACEVVRQQRGYVGCGEECLLNARCDADGRGTECTGLVASLQLALLIYSRMFLHSHDSEWEERRLGALATLGMSEEVLARFA